MKRGYTLIEILVVVTLFVGVAVIVTQSLLLSIRGARKNMALTKVRENLSSSIDTMKTNLLNAISIESCVVNEIRYKNPDFSISSFSCGSGRVSWGTSSLTGNDVNVSNCSFVCDAPPYTYVTINLTGQSVAETGLEAESVNMSTKINFRNLSE